MSVTIMLSRYSGFPPELFEKGLAPKMRDCSFRLYVLLCRESDRMNSRRVSFSDSYAKKLAKISPSSMRFARKQLKELRLASCVRDPGGEYSYDLYDLRTGLPYPGDPKHPFGAKAQRRRPSGLSGPSDRPPALLSSNPSSSRVNRPNMTLGSHRMRLANSSLERMLRARESRNLSDPSADYAGANREIYRGVRHILRCSGK